MLHSIDIEDIRKIAFEAGQEILKIYNQKFDIDYKLDSSPVTKADLVANQIICDRLQSLYPNIPIISEENQQIEYEVRKDWLYYWCIDPLDGTKEFIKKNGEFTVNIALIHKDTPVLGVVYIPVLGDIYSAKKGAGVYKNSKKLLPTISRSLDTLKVMVSKSHFSTQTQEFIKSFTTKKIVTISKGSSLKFCLIAEGLADIYPRLTPTMEWDTAAADAIVRESGKMTYQISTDKPLVYNKKDLHNPSFVVK